MYLVMVWYIQSTTTICRLPASIAVGSKSITIGALGCNNGNNLILICIDSHCNNAMAVATVKLEGMLCLPKFRSGLFPLTTCSGIKVNGTT